MERSVKPLSVKLLVLLFVLVGITEMLGEYFRYEELIWKTKPLLMPLLAAVYFYSSRKPNYIYLFTLIFPWIAGLFFISGDSDDFFTGVLIFLMFRICILILVIRLIGWPRWLPALLGGLPFFFIYLFILNDTYPDLGSQLVMFVAQGIFISILGGIAVSNYILRSNHSGPYLLMGMLLFATSQFLFVVKLIYYPHPMIMPIMMVTYLTGHYLMCRFVLAVEEEAHESITPADTQMLSKS